MANSFDQFDSNPFDQFEETGQSVSMVDQIPGLTDEFKGKRKKELEAYEARKKAEDNPIKMIQGFLEPLAVAGSGSIAGVAALPYAGVQKLAGDKRSVTELANKMSEDLTYQPRTLVGEKLTKDYVAPAFESLAALGLSAPLQMAGVAMQGRPKGAKGKPVVDKLKALDEIPPEVKAVGEQMELPLDNSPQQIAEMQNRGSGQLDMFAPVNEPQTAVPRPNMDPMNPVRPMKTTNQFDMFDQPEQGRMANPYEAALGDWRVDENGIPIKADLSMELQNLENPLQRNLWGDELPPTKSPVGQGLQGVEDGSTQMGVPLTQAIDSMPDLPWKTDRDVGIGQLTGELPADGPLQAAQMEANSQWTNYSQRGQFNPEMFGVRRNGRDFEAMLGSDKVGFLKPNITPEEAKMLGEPASIDMVKVNQDQRGQGMGRELYKAFHDAYDGNIVPSGKTTKDAWKVWKREYPSKVDDFIKQEAARVAEGADPSMVIGNITDPEIAQKVMTQAKDRSLSFRHSERGAIDPDLLTMGLVSKLTKIADYTPASPEIQEAKKALEVDQSKAAAYGILGKNADAYRNNIDTPEKVIAAVADAKDITGAQLQRGKTVAAGINSMVLNSNNPLLKYLRTVSKNAIFNTDQTMRKFITDKGGISTTWGRMDQGARAEAISVLHKGDKEMRYYTLEELNKAGFSEDQAMFVQQVYDMQKEKLKQWNEAREKDGLPPVNDRPGTFPGVFKGDYTQLVYKKDKDGNTNIIGVIKTDTKWQMKTAQKKVAGDHPEAFFSSVDRRSLGGNGPRSDIFSGVNDVLNVLSRENPEFANIQKIVKNVVIDSAQKIGQAHLHAKDKKGVFGNEGNKSWLSEKENTEAAFKGFLDYFEQGILSHNLQGIETDLAGLFQNKALEGMPKAKEYANDYFRGLTGRNIADVGTALNVMVDAPFRLLGLGPSAVRGTINQLNKRASQWTMGMGNYVFSGVQLLQMAQSAVPEIVRLGELTGNKFSAAEASLAMPKALLDSVRMMVAEKRGEKADVSPVMQTAFEEAKRRGLTQFSEFQDVNAVTQSKASQRFDKVADFNRSVAENSTRPVVFYTLVKMLEGKVPEGQLYDIAYNATQSSMIDYHYAERPQMYAKMGVTGQLAGSLQTFKHGYMAQMGRNMSPGTPVAALATATALVGLAGVKGIPGYQELDELVKLITDKVFGERKSLQDVALKSLPEWVKSGALSTATGVNMQSRLSAADVLPNSLPEAVSPFSNFYGEAATSAYDLAKNRDSIGLKNMGRAMLPSGPAKGMYDTTVMTNEKGIPVDKQGRLGNPREEFDTKVRRYSGATSLREALFNEKQYDQQMRALTQETARKNITEKLIRKMRQGNITPEDLQSSVKQYRARKGDPNQLINQLISERKLLNQTKQQRLQGVPADTISSLERYLNYNPQE